MPTVAFLPVYQNPYQHLLTDALRRAGVEVEHHADMPSARWLTRERRRVDVLHFHWLDGLYMRRLLTPLVCTRYVARFLLARELGYKIVWTAHNILPHRRPFPPMHLAIRRLMMARADAVIAHCEYGRHELLQHFPRRKPVHVVPLGTYSGVYPSTATRAAARTRLGIAPDQFVYLFLGNITGYKGLKRFAATFRQQETENSVVIIAGRNRDAALVRHLEAAAEADTRLRIHAGFIPDHEMQIFLHAADVMVAPFDEILTSSSVMVGMCYALPIIAPAMGCLPELVTPETGILYDPADPAALGGALRRIRQMDTAGMGAAAKAFADTFRWDDIARQTTAIYRQCLEATP